MPFFRKKPVVIEAVQFTHEADCFQQLLDFTGNTFRVLTTETEGYTGRIKTLEGVMTATPGDYIIKGVKGEFYPCKPEIFATTYEVV